MHSRTWVARGEYQARIEHALDPLGASSSSPLVFYGPAGIGKSGLCRSLLAQLQPQHLCVLIDGQDLAQRSVESWERVLIRLRRDLAQAQPQLTCFDLAFCHYLKQTQLTPPRLAIEVSEALGWGDLGQTADLMDLVLEDRATQTIPFVSSLAKLGWFVIQLGNLQQWEWYRQSPGRPLLQEIATHLQDREILQRLPGLLMQDLQRYLEQDSSSGSRRLVICVDDADRLWADPLCCQWLQSLMEPSHAQVLWVFFAQDRIEGWPEAEQVKLEPMTEAESLSLLQGLGIESPETAQIILEEVAALGLAGMPFALWLGATCGTLDPQDQQELRQKLTQRLAHPHDLGDPQLQQILEILAHPVAWDREIAIELLQTLGLGNGEEQWPQILELPGVESVEKGWFRIQSGLRRACLDHSPQGKTWRVHQGLAEIYQRRFEAGGQLHDLEQAVRHGQQGWEPEASLDWVVQQAPGLIERGIQQGLVSLLADLWVGDQVDQLLAWVGLRLGQGLMALEEWDLAQGVLEQVSRIWVELGAEESLEAAETAVALGEIYLTDTRTWEAYRVLRQALQIRQQQLGRGSIQVAEVLNRLSEAAIQRPNLQESLDWSQEALQCLEQDPEADPIVWVEQQETVAYLHYQIDDLREAIRLYQKAMTRLQNQKVGLGLKISITAQIGAALEQLTNYQWALHHYRIALHLAEGRLEPGHPQISRLLKTIARICRQVGLKQRAQEFEERLRDEIDLWTQEEDPIRFAQRLRRLGRRLFQESRYDRAEPTWILSVRILQKYLGIDQAEVAAGCADLAELYQVQGRLEEAMALGQQALSLRQRVWGQEHVDVAASLDQVADLYRRQGQLETAASLGQQALALRQKLLDEDHEAIAASFHTLAWVAIAQGDYDQAEDLCQRSLDLRQKRLGNTHIEVAYALDALAELRQAQDRSEAAAPLLQQAHQIASQVLGTHHPYARSLLARLQDLNFGS